MILCSLLYKLLHPTTNLNNGLSVRGLEETHGPMKTLLV